MMKKNNIRKYINIKYLYIKMSFTVFIKNPIEGEKFWEEDNITIINVYPTLEEAQEEQTKTAKDYIHNQDESGFKLHIKDDVILITKDITEVSKGYIYNSNYIRQKPIFSVHIKKFGQFLPPPPPPAPKIATNSHHGLLVQDLQKSLHNGISLKKTGIDLTNEEAYIKIVKYEEHPMATAISNYMDNKN